MAWNSLYQQNLQDMGGGGSPLLQAYEYNGADPVQYYGADNVTGTGDTYYQPGNAGSTYPTGPTVTYQSGVTGQDITSQAPTQTQEKSWSDPLVAALSSAKTGMSSGRASSPGASGGGGGGGNVAGGAISGAVSGASAGLGAATALGMANAWNPAGWMMLGGAALGALGGGLSGSGGGETKASRAAAKDAEVRAEVHDDMGDVYGGTEAVERVTDLPGYLQSPLGYAMTYGEAPSKEEAWQMAQPGAGWTGKNLQAQALQPVGNLLMPAARIAMWTSVAANVAAIAPLLMKFKLNKGGM